MSSGVGGRVAAGDWVEVEHCGLKELECSGCVCLAARLRSFPQHDVPHTQYCGCRKDVDEQAEEPLGGDHLDRYSQGGEVGVHLKGGGGLFL